MVSIQEEIPTNTIMNWNTHDCVAYVRLCGWSIIVRVAILLQREDTKWYINVIIGKKPWIDVDESNDLDHGLLRNLAHSITGPLVAHCESKGMEGVKTLCCYSMKLEIYHKQFLKVPKAITSCVWEHWNNNKDNLKKNPTIRIAF